MHATEASTAAYTVRVEPERHELQITLHLQGPAATGRVRLEIPTWVPGDYTFMQLARDLMPISAVDPRTGTALKVERDGWQAFVIEGGTGDLQVSYRALGYEPEFGEPSGLIDDAFAITLGARYLHSPAWLGPCTVTYQLPDRWRDTLHHPAGALRIADDTWEYPSFEVLLDTPVVMGGADIRKRVVAGTPFFFAFVDRGIGYDQRVDAFIDDVCAAAADMGRMFEGFPFDYYTFVLSLNPTADWGLEHLTSTMCGLGPDVFTDDDQYAIGVRVCAHELFHAWNVRRLRPAPLGQLAHALTHGSFTEGLWIAEGFTRYYEFLSCTRSGTYTPQQFISNVVGYLQHLTVLPAYHRISGTDSSLSTYLTHSPSYPGRPNNCIDYYDKGMLIAFSVDATLRLETEEDTLDAAFAAFYEKYVGDPVGYTTEQALAFFTARHKSLGPLLASTATHPGGLTVESLLERLGFKVCHEPTHRLGLYFADGGMPTIDSVLDDSPAGQSGLAAGDVITGINGYAWSEAGLKWVARHAEPVTLAVARGHRRLTYTMQPTLTSHITKLVWQGDNAQAERLSRWFGGKIPLTPGQDVPVDFYENFHGVETVL
ncbi:MAG: hypothetical protein KC620_02750 [Myxococcales bacterium]|nr:hypothetical protein [Myxococcales bacterium]